MISNNKEAEKEKSFSAKGNYLLHSFEYVKLFTCTGEDTKNTGLSSINLQLCSRLSCENLAGVQIKLGQLRSTDFTDSLGSTERIANMDAVVHDVISLSFVYSWMLTGYILLYTQNMENANPYFYNAILHNKFDGRKLRKTIYKEVILDVKSYYKIMRKIKHRRKENNEETKTRRYNLSCASSNYCSIANIGRYNSSTSNE